MNNQNNTEIKKQIESDVAKHIRVLRGKITKFLSEEKPSDVLIIKSHLICEYYINQVLIVKDSCTAKEITNLSFYDKVNKAFDTKNSEEKILHDKMTGLNKLRNKVGHELEYVLSESDVDTLGYITGKEYVFNKYDYPEIDGLLRNTLTMIVINVSMFLFELISIEKRKQEETSQTPEKG